MQESPFKMPFSSSASTQCLTPSESAIVLENMTKLPPIRRYVVLVISACALFYAFCAGLRTIGDFDFGWQIATGRYIAQHHQIPRVDVLSYTVPGVEWLYPPFSGLIFYWLFLLGGYTALSWLLAAAAVATVAFLLRRPGLATGIAAILAVPSIVFRANPRAELFTTVLFAVYLALLWKFFRDGRATLSLLPVLMLFWVNLHPGFITGIALLLVYVALKTCELVFPACRGGAVRRLRKIGPWVVASLAVTLINPWGAKIYAGIVRQNRSVKELGDFIGEWSKPNLSVPVFRQMLHLRNAENSFWWLLLLAIAAIVVSLWRRQFGAAVLLAGAAFLSIQYLRFQGLFACIAVVIGGGILDELWAPRHSSRSDAVNPEIGRLRACTDGIALVLCAALVILTGIRCADLITNRHYIEGGEVVLFGTGEASWFPERATRFVSDKGLPGNLFNDYNLGGYIEWRLPEFKAYVDSRAIPFGVELLTHQRTLMTRPLDSPEWAKEADERNINVIILSLDRYTGLGKAPLDIDCGSRNWLPVYVDEISAVFLRNTPQNAGLIQRLGVDCTTVHFSEPEDARGDSYRARANAYNFYANAGSVLYLLGRDQEAQQNLARAVAIQPHDSNLHLTRAQLFQADGMLADAEREYKASIAERPTDFAWYLLGILYGRQDRYREAVGAMERSAEISYNPADRYRVVGQIENAMQQPKDALEAFDRAESIGSHGSVEDQKIFRAQLASGRSRSWELLHDLDRAIQEQHKSVQLLPNDSGRWSTLAQLYHEKGDTSSAEQAQARAEALRSAGSGH
jgi:tetratricopeptide (TPR) repeat protein